MNNNPSWIVRIPTPIWTIGLIIVALLIDLPLQYPAIVQHRPTGIVLIGVGIGLSGWGRLTFKRHNAEVYPWSAAHRTIVAGGPFRFTRNPMYLGFVVLGVGAALVAGTWLMWLVPLIVFALDNFVIIPFEERSMERTFGDAYREYKARVRRWL
jgi:protein-S-isoprenylcysteine O-methyltransferase Ste14